MFATWFSSSSPMSHHGRDVWNLPVDANGPIYRLVTETVRLADPSVDFSQFDANGDGIVDHLTVVHAGAGQESGGSLGLLLSHPWDSLDGGPPVPRYPPPHSGGVPVGGDP